MRGARPLISHKSFAIIIVTFNTVAELRTLTDRAVAKRFTADAICAQRAVLSDRRYGAARKSAARTELQALNAHLRTLGA